jgi:WD40 repeat protein
MVSAPIAFRDKFRASIPNWVSILPSVPQTWNQRLFQIDGTASNGHGPPVFSADSSVVAANVGSDAIRIWIGKLIQEISLPGNILQFTFTANGKQIRAISSQTSTAGVYNGYEVLILKEVSTYDLGNGEVVNVFSITKTRCRDGAVLSADGKLLAFAELNITESNSTTHIHIWCAATAKPIEEVCLPTFMNGTLQFSPDSRLLALYSEDSILLWCLSTDLTCTRLTFSEPKGEFQGFSQDGRLVFCEGDDLLLVDTAAEGELEIISTPEEGYGWSKSISCWTISRALLAVSRNSAPTEVFNRQQEVWNLMLETSRCHYLVISPDEQVIACSGSGRTSLFQVWDITAAKQTYHMEERLSSQDQLLEFNSNVSAFATSPDNKLLACACSHTSWSIWILSTAFSRPPRQIADLSFNNFGVHHLLFSPNSRFMLAADHRFMNVIVFDLESENVNVKFRGSSEYHSPVFSNDSELLSLKHDDELTQRILIVNIVTGEENFKREFQRDRFIRRDLVQALAFSPNNKVLVIQHNQELLLWDLKENNEVTRLTLERHDYIVEASFSPDDKLLAISKHDRQIQILLVHTLEPILRINVQRISLDRKHGGKYDLRFSEDSQRLTTRWGTISLLSQLVDVDFKDLRLPDAILIEDPWITRGGKRLFWLGGEYTEVRVIGTDLVCILVDRSLCLLNLKL